MKVANKVNDDVKIVIVDSTQRCQSELQSGMMSYRGAQVGACNMNMVLF